MKRIKEFYKKHEREIKLVGIATGCVIGYKGIKSIQKDFTNRKNVIVDMTGKSYASWYPGNTEFMNLETAKKILDLNAGSNDTFGIFKEGAGYTCVSFGSDIIIPE